MQFVVLRFGGGYRGYRGVVIKQLALTMNVGWDVRERAAGAGTARMALASVARWRLAPSPLRFEQFSAAQSSAMTCRAQPPTTKAPYIRETTSTTIQSKRVSRVQWLHLPGFVSQREIIQEKCREGDFVTFVDNLNFSVKAYKCCTCLNCSGLFCLVSWGLTKGLTMKLNVKNYEFMGNN